MQKEPSQISVDRLLEELDIDWKILRGRCKELNIGQIKRKGFVSCNEADRISSRHRGIPIDWSKFKTEARDNIIGSILKRHSFEKDFLLENWYLKLSNVNDFGESSSFLGIACTGGFLHGKDCSNNEPFIISLQKGINIFIGERGSGKSTTLSMLTLLSDSTSERAYTLINIILILFQEKKIDENRWIRNIWGVLKKYSIEKYACYFCRNSNLFSFFVNTETQEYDLLIREQDQWCSFTGEFYEILPKMQVFRQGEVFRIADDKQQYVLNNIMDELYPDIFKQREKLVKQYIPLAQKYEKLSVSILEIDGQFVDNFLNKYSNELRRLEEDKKSGNTLSILNKIESYLLDYDRLPPYLSESPIFELFQSETGLFFFYITKIHDFLKEKFSIIRQLSRDLKNDINKQESQILIKQNIERVLEFLRVRISLIKTIEDDLNNLPIYDEYLASICQQYISFIENQSTLIKNQESCCREITHIIKENLDIYLFTSNAKNLLEQNENFLNSLKQAKENYAFLSCANMKITQKELSEVFNNYKNSINQLFRKLDMTKGYNLLSSEKLDTKYLKNIIFFPVELELLQGNNYRSFEQLSFGQKSGIILTIALKMTPADILVIDQPEDNLDSDSIINLLAPTLSNQNEKHDNRTIIIATHNSNLVMTLSQQNPYIFVMKTLGDSGCIDITGNLQEQAVVEYMFNILEGGINAYEEKLKLYEQFIKELVTHNKNIDIAFIERSYRRDTIDSLRNYLQPVVTDKFILQSLRHELNNLAQKGEVLSQSSWLRQSLTELQEEITRKKNRHFLKSNLFGLINKFIGLFSRHRKNDKLAFVLNKIDDFIKSLDSHLKQITITINDIDEMDTNPKPEKFMLYILLEDVIKAIKDRTDQVDFDLTDQRLQDVKIYADPNHTKLILRNIFKNSARSTEIKAVDNWENPDYTQTIRISVVEIGNPLKVILQIEDNGTGIDPSIKDKIYQRPCSTQKTGDHGNGGMIISKLLKLNGGSITVIETQQGENSGTIQQITFLTHTPRNIVVS